MAACTFRFRKNCAHGKLHVTATLQPVPGEAAAEPALGGRGFGALNLGGNRACFV